MTWPPNNQPTGGKSDSTPMATDHPTEHNAIKDTLDDIIAENAGALPLAGGGIVDGGVTADLFQMPTNDDDNVLLKTYTANGYQLMQLQIGTGNTIEIGGPDSYARADTISMSTKGVTRLHVNGDGDVEVNGQLIVPSAKAITTGSPSTITGGPYGLAVGDASSYKGALAISADNIAIRYPIELYNPNGIVGRIVTQGTSTRYDTSATRSAEDVAAATAIPDALGTLEALRFRRFTEDDGVDAATAHEVYPFAVSAGMDPDNPDYGVDYGRFTPLLGAALLELKAKVEELTARVEALET